MCWWRLAISAVGLASACTFQSKPRKLTRGKLLMKHTYGYKTQHSTVTEIHTLNNTVANGFNQLAPPARTISLSLDMSNAFDTINIHTH